MANSLAAQADVVVGVGTRWTDFTTGSRTVFADPDVRFVNLNITSFDAAKHGAVMVVADARAALEALSAALVDWRVPEEWTGRLRELTEGWKPVADAALRGGESGPPPQTAILGVVNDLVLERGGTVVSAAGSMPGQLQMLWRTGDPFGYHVEYGYSCMGFEIAGGLGAKMAAPDRDVIVLVGDGSYLMMAQELVTAVAEGIKLVVVLVDNGGFASIGALSESLGGMRFGTAYRRRSASTGLLDGEPLPVDLGANAASLGARVLQPTDLDGLRKALVEALDDRRTTVIHVRTELVAPAPSSGCWWDVPVAAVSELPGTRAAREVYDAQKRRQRPLL